MKLTLHCKRSTQKAFSCYGAILETGSAAHEKRTAGTGREPMTVLAVDSVCCASVE
jgi:hypothetical protein